MTASQKVIVNTIILYIKMIITIIIGLYLTRIVLNKLGVEDYGIYNLIGGVLSMLSFLQSALNVSTQRYLSVSMGENNDDSIQRIFSSSLLIHILFAILILIVLESCSLFLFDGFLNISQNRIPIAKYVYQIMVFSTIISILQVPFSAEITAHEDLWFYAIVEIIAAFIKLCIIFIFNISPIDALITYSLWMLLVTFVSTLIKIIWCGFLYRECRKILFWQYASKNDIKEMVGFTGWNAFGTLALVGRNQGIAILLNIFWGTAINTVYGIANQVNSQLSYFSQVVTTSLSPRIMKKYGAGDVIGCLRLSFFTSKISFFLSCIVAIPLILEIQNVLKFWLKEVPDSTDIYCVLILLTFVIMQLYPGLTRAIQATGKIKSYQIMTSILLLLPLPVGYLLFKIGYSDRAILYSMIVSQILQLYFVVYYSYKILRLDIKKFFLYILKSALCFIISYIICDYLKYSINWINAFCEFLTITTLSILIFSTLFYCIVFNKNEKQDLYTILHSLIVKKNNI